MPSKMGFTIQAGAFSRAENAAKLTGKLNREGLSAYYFVYKTGLYKVRFGNFQIREGRRWRCICASQRHSGRGLQDAQEGQRVSFDVQQGPKGPAAANVKPL